MVLDFVLVGSVNSATVATAALQLVSYGDAAKSAAVDDGVRHAVMRWGSDHLPVAWRRRACQASTSYGA